MKKRLNLRFFVFLALIMASMPFFVHAQDIISCKTEAEKILCQQAYDKIQAEIEEGKKVLTSLQAQSSSISRDIKILDAKIKAAQLDIKAKNLLIKTLGNDIIVKQDHIVNLEGHITKGKETLAQVLRKTNEIDQNTLPELILSQSTVASFFQDIDSFDSLRQGLQSTFDQLRSDQNETTAEKNALDKRRSAETDARYAIQQQQKSIESNQKAKQQLLVESKSSEKTQANVIAQKQIEAAKIRAALFPLAGGGEPIKFGDAYNFALEAEKKTGIRPAFLLGIFAQESSLDGESTFGKNVGLCYLANTITGDGIGANTRTVKIRTMKPTRDVSYFLQILGALGMNMDTTRVSCWIPVYDAGVPSGWGGAMGPAQFLPSTWVNDYKDKVAKLLGISGMPNPWNPEHAFMASAMYLTDLGAGKRTPTAEKTAALKYFAGGEWNLKKNASYGNNVMINAGIIQGKIDKLQGL